MKTTIKKKTERAWHPSHREEIIAALWFIVAFTALGADCPLWVFITFFIKACLDVTCSIKHAMDDE